MRLRRGRALLGGRHRLGGRSFCGFGAGTAAQLAARARRRAVGGGAGGRGGLDRRRGRARRRNYLPVEGGARLRQQRDVAPLGVELDPEEARVVRHVDEGDGGRGGAVGAACGRGAARGRHPARRLDVPEGVAVAEVALADVLLDEAAGVGGAGPEHLPQVDVAAERGVERRERLAGDAARLDAVRRRAQLGAAHLVVEQAEPEGAGADGAGGLEGGRRRVDLAGRGHGAVGGGDGPDGAVRGVHPAVAPVGEPRRLQRAAVGEQRRQQVERAGREAVGVVVAGDQDDGRDVRESPQEGRHVLEVVGGGPHLVVEDVAGDDDEVEFGACGGGRGGSGDGRACGGGATATTNATQARVKPVEDRRVLGAAAVLDVDVGDVGDAHNKDYKYINRLRGF